MEADLRKTQQVPVLAPRQGTTSLRPDADFQLSAVQVELIVVGPKDGRPQRTIQVLQR